MSTIYEFSAKDITGQLVQFSDFKNKPLLIVNTASKCGFTPQYKGLEELYEKNKGKLVIIGFPANNFLFQEPGKNADIQTFCQRNYGVTFPMAAKISVKGKDMHPLYVYLTQKKYNGFSDNSVKWNFQKYLIDEQGKLVAVFSPNTDPLSEEILNAIKK